MSQELENQFGIIDFENGEKRGINTVAEWLKYSPNVKGIINAIMPEIQELHDAQKDVYSTINIFEAVGTQLDDIFGEILDTPRLTGETDDEYRANLLAATARLAKSGEIVTMKGVFRSLLGATSVLLFEYQAAKFKIQGTAPTVPCTSQLQTLRDSLETAKQGGNGMSLSITDSSTPFTLGAYTTPQLNLNTGLSGTTTNGILLTGF